MDVVVDFPSDAQSSNQCNSANVCSTTQRY